MACVSAAYARQLLRSFIAFYGRGMLREELQRGRLTGPAPQKRPPRGSLRAWSGSIAARVCAGKRIAYHAVVAPRKEADRL
jgi:hypothetical protein